MDGSEQQAQRSPEAGWYPHPSMANTRRYWDGERWTDHIAPAPVVQQPQKGVSAFTIARGVALGIAALIAIIWVVGTVVSADDGIDCATRNAERALGQRSGPSEVCPD